MLFRDMRFGMFIHWGIYSVGAWHEQEQWRYPVDSGEYMKYAQQFNPVLFDPEQWLDLVEEAGMDYVCFTTKHHDGFCMWDTAYTDFTIMNTSYGKDVLKLLADACHRRGIGLSLYYSVPDWHHKNYPNQGGSHELAYPKPGDEPDEDKYVEYVKNQLTELCTNYGKIESFFWDIPPVRRDPSLNEYIRKMQPGILINDRGYDEGDFATPERSLPEGGRFERYTEACQSVGWQAWGYRKNEDYYSHKFLMESIDIYMAMGGNYLLNVGPKPDGTIPPEAQDSLRAIGEWYKRVKEALWAEPASHLIPSSQFLLTAKDNTLYLHFHKSPESNGLILETIGKLPKSATVLNNEQELYAAFERMPTLCSPPHAGRPVLHLNRIPIDQLAGEVIILKLEFDDLAAAIQQNAKISQQNRF